MDRKSLCFPVLLFTASFAYADIRQLELPELVGNSDLIVIGVPERTVDLMPSGHYLMTYKIPVSAVLYGTAERKLTVAQWRSYRLQETPGIIFLFETLYGPELLYPLSSSPYLVDDVLRLIRLRTDPGSYFADPRIGSSPEFLELLGYTFRRTPSVGRIDRPVVAEHLRRQLVSKNGETARHAVLALTRIGDKNSALEVIPLLKDERPIQRTAILYLEHANDKRAVGPLCAALDMEDDREVADLICRALGKLRDPVAVPFLERAIKRGVIGWSCWALGVVGSEKHFELLLELFTKNDEIDAGEGMIVLVHRSNKKVEPWMTVNSVKNKTDWIKWWAANQETFKIVKTADEAFGKR